MRLQNRLWKLAARISAQLAATGYIAFGLAANVDAGPFADWWLNNSGNAYAGYPNTSYSPVLPAGAPQSIVGVLPTAAYESQYYRVPTTYYRPVTSFDPRLGTTVTSLQPCTSYQYQAQRVPLLAPQTYNSAYGGYAANSPLQRYAPVYNPSIYNPSMVPMPGNGGAAGQSSLSIPSGLGTQYVAPVVQMPNNGVPMQTQLRLQSQPVAQVPYGQPVTSGYSGINYGPTQAYSQPINNFTNSPVTTAVVPAAAWTTTTSQGGYIGSAPQQFSQPALTSPTLSNQMIGSNMLSNSSGATITPIGPPVITSAPTSNQSFNQSTSSSYGPSFGPMPGAMGVPTMPGSVNSLAPSTMSMPSNVAMPSSNPLMSAPAYNSTPFNSAPLNSASPSLRDNESMTRPQLPPSSQTFMAPQVTPSYQQQSPAQQPYDRNQLKPEIMPLDILPSQSSDPDATRFQLRRVERAPIDQTSKGMQGDTFTRATVNTFGPTNNISSNIETSRGLMDAPNLNVKPAETTNSEPDLKLESLRPIPAPSTFDGSPAWRPVLLNPRDQTASLQSKATNHRLASDTTAKPILRHLSPSVASSPIVTNEELNSNLIYFQSQKTSATK